MKKLSILLLCGALATSTVVLNSCIKKDFDVPEDNTGFDPQLTVTHSIAEILAMPLNQAIAEDAVVAGVVVMDDRTGNYYKKFVIQDSTGGLEINLDQNNIYNDYPVGRKVYVKCKGLFLASYGGMKQMGIGIDEQQSIVPIPFTQASNYIVKANYPNPIKVDTVSYDELADPSLNTARLNTIVAIKNAEFAATDAFKPYTDPSSTTNRTLEACGTTTNKKIVVRTSNFARFRGAEIPAGNGVVVGLYTKYNTTAQLILRDTTDVQLTNPVRCNGSILKQPIFEENFTGGANNAVVEEPGWMNIPQVGTQKYVYYVGSNGNACAKITAYGSGEADVQSWLITPQIDLNGASNPELSVRTTYGFPDGATLKAYVTTSFNGDPAASTWTELDPIIVPGQPNWSWQGANVTLNAFAGQKIYIGFKYVGGTVGTSTFEIDDIKVVAD